jgi:hypothetical protein
VLAGYFFVKIHMSARGQENFPDLKNGSPKALNPIFSSRLIDKTELGEYAFTYSIGKHKTDHILV